MGIDFDKLVNKRCIGEVGKPGIFGEDAIYNNGTSTITVPVSFEKSYQDVSLGIDQVPVSSNIPTCFIRVQDLGFEPKQGHTINIQSVDYRISDARVHIPGSFQLMLKEKK